MSGPQIWKAHGEKLAAMGAFLALLSLTLWMWSNATADAMHSAKAHFDFKVSEAKFAIRQRLLAYEHVLRGGVGLLAASENVTREEWHTYVGQVDIDTHYQGIQGIGFSLRILPEYKAAHLQAVRAEGFPDYAIRPAGERPEYTTIIYLEPFNWRNRRAFGYDMFSEPVRRSAMERARDTGLPSLSGKVTLVQETEHSVQHGFLMYLPVYPEGIVPPTVEQRRTALVGYVYSPFRMNDLMQGILGRDALPDMDLKIYDGGVASANALMYDSAGEPLPNAAFSATTVIDLNGRSWTLRFDSLPAFDAAIDRQRTRLILSAGVLISLLFSVVVWSLAANRRRALALAEANRGLRAEIAERRQTEAKLARAKDLAEAANRAKSTFLSSMSHELRTPLNAIIGFSEALGEQLFGELNERQARYVDNIHAAGRHLLLLINDILDLSKVEAGRMALEVAEFDLPAILEHAMTLVRERAASHGIALSPEVDPALGRFKGDERKVKQILLNLLSNAVKFTPDGGCVTLQAKAAQGAVEIAVTDSGIGIAEQDLAAIFQEFTQVGRTDPGKQEGTGLGLALSRKFAELHGGALTAQSAPGQGSTFTVTLPERP